MAKESEFVETARQIARRILTGGLEIERGAALLYEITVDNTLSVTVDPKNHLEEVPLFRQTFAFSSVVEMCVFLALSWNLRCASRPMTF